MSTFDPLLTPKRSLGQHFLRDRNMLRALCHSVHPHPEDTMVEYCAGHGALTQTLVGRTARLYAVELDHRLVEVLQRELHDAIEGQQLIIAHCDALSYDLAQFDRPVRLVGNLAYNISVPLLLACLRDRPQIVDAHFMVQKEVSDRLTARSGQRDFGRLAVVMQTWFEISCLRKVPAECFTPRPQVESAFVRLVPHRDPPLAWALHAEFEIFVRHIFAMRRKRLSNNLKAVYSAERIEFLQTHNAQWLNQRADQLELSQLIELFHQIKEPL